jgi:hypothetical protein
MLIKPSTWTCLGILNEGPSHNIKVDNSPFKKVEELKYLGTTLTNQNSVQEEIKSRLKSRNSSFQSYVFQFAIHKFKD